jgi:hypothetical protein
MNSLTLSKKLALVLLGLLIISTTSLWAADDCELKKAAALAGCKDKSVKATGPRVEMTAVPEYFALADPGFTGGEGLQDYMAIGETQIILHTKEEVQCPKNIEVAGQLKQIDLEGNKAWVVEVKNFKCVDN